MKRKILKLSVLILLFTFSTLQVSAKNESLCAEIDRTLADTLLIPFGIGWGGGGNHGGDSPVPIYCPDFAQTGDLIIVLSSSQMVIPYRIYRDGVSTPKVQGFLYVAPPSNVVANTSQWESGDYTMYITIAGIQFYGTFSIE